MSGEEAGYGGGFIGNHSERMPSGAASSAAAQRPPSPGQTSLLLPQLLRDRRGQAPAATNTAAVGWTLPVATLPVVPGWQAAAPSARLTPPCEEWAAEK